jgi:hypothetical protein
MHKSAMQVIKKVITACTNLSNASRRQGPTSAGVKTEPALLEMVMLAGDKHRRTALHHAAFAGNVKAVQAICKVMQTHSLPIDKQDYCGWTPLHLASASGHADCVDALLKASASPCRVDALGWVPVHYAAKVCCSPLDTLANLVCIRSTSTPKDTTYVLLQVGYDHHCLSIDTCGSLVLCIDTTVVHDCAHTSGPILCFTDKRA